MPTTHLEEMRDDINDAAHHLETISQMLQSHALFLRSKNLDHLSGHVLLVENRVGALTLSIEDLKGAALRISKVA